MAYTIPQIINWAKIAQPLARLGETTRKSRGDSGADPDLDIKLYMTRKDVEYEYAQAPSGENIFAMGNYLLSLMGIYLFAAQGVTGGGGTISPITPSGSGQYYVIQTGVTGAAGQPVAGESTYQNDLLIGGTQLAFIFVNDQMLSIGMGEITFDASTGTLSLQDGNVWALSQRIQIPFVRA